MTAAAAAGHLVTTAEVLADLATGTPLGTRVYRVAPGELAIGRNVRTVGVEPDEGLVASVAESGVLEPVLCYVLDGALQVDMGQRRVLAAVRAGRACVPVVVVDEPPEDERIVGQVAENEHRRGLATSDRVAAVQQLSLLGLPAGAIARRVALRRDDVDHALTVAATPVVCDVLDDGAPLDLAEAAAVAEFADRPDVVDALAVAARAGALEHALEAAREDRRDQDARARVLAELAATGTPVLDERPGPDDPARTLDELGLTPAAHTDCPARAAYLTAGDHTVDGHRVHGWHPVPVCLTPGLHHAVPDAATPARQTTLDTEQARRERERTHQLRREWRIATRVRRSWLRDFARTRTALLPGGEAFAAFTVAAYPGVLLPALGTHHWMTRTLLYRDADAAHAPREEAPPAQRATETERLQRDTTTASRVRAVRLSCLLLLAAWEEQQAGEDTWRCPSPVTAHVLTQMAAWGHRLAPIEQVAAGQLSLDDLGQLPEPDAADGTR